MMRAPFNRPRATLSPPKTPRKRQSLIGNGMHSPANATALQCATSIFLIGNEFHLQRAAFQRVFTRRSGTRAKARTTGLVGGGGAGEGASGQGGGVGDRGAGNRQEAHLVVADGVEFGAVATRDRLRRRQRQTLEIHELAVAFDAEIEV